MANLVIKNLKASVNGIEILKGINLEMDLNEIHALLGPNGHGKSTLLGVLMGNPKYEVTEGTITWDGEDLLAMSVDERSRKGLFLAMQYPSEITGVTNSDFIKTAMHARLAEGETLPLLKFIRSLDKACEELKMREDLPHRYVNEGFSGGEKKRNEILQMKLLKPKFAILDEIDSGLDVDALRIVGENVNDMKSENFGSLIITHYERLLDYIKADYVHILMNGTVVRSGGLELMEKVDKEGYDWLKEELGLDELDEGPNITNNILGTCAVKDAMDKGDK